MEVMDSNNNGYIDYSEFIAACLQSHNYLMENHLLQAFAFFDKDGSGTISHEELMLCLCDEEMTLPEDVIGKMLSEVDLNQDGQIDYNEFIIMMKNNSQFGL